jgi:hypothetical protein
MSHVDEFCFLSFYNVTHFSVSIQSSPCVSPTLQRATPSLSLSLLCKAKRKTKMFPVLLHGQTSLPKTTAQCVHAYALYSIKL